MSECDDKPTVVDAIVTGFRNIARRAEMRGFRVVTFPQLERELAQPASRLVNPDVVDELRRVERKPSPSMLCDVCDRPPLWSVNHGKGWSVRYLPHRERIALTPIAEFRASNFVAYTVFTCGGEICVWRAAHHGYPGMRAHRTTAA